ncbi:uncharacterized protein LOC123322473 [Coccinella septempunctata]|uniref:uncharacterized protein LOC123322471 n=1 Tax=Coccinella septempunctata TaxID=41139 RepID=UPI001D089499|nr:uncharacterized protein LOC123322471 [Coccinella septempunctata]XP_044766383.1 uncharacterized protein LOC123322473 [Coccinella septempunctata]
MDRAHGDLEYETFQFLSGHGCFGTYRKKIGKSNSAQCWNCQRLDKPDHILFCRKWEDTRKDLARATDGNPDFKYTKHNIVAKILENEVKWNLITEWIRTVMKAKAEEERERENAGRKPEQARYGDDGMMQPKMTTKPDYDHPDPNSSHIPRA